MGKWELARGEGESDASNTVKDRVGDRRVSTDTEGDWDLDTVLEATVGVPLPEPDEITCVGIIDG